MLKDARIDAIKRRLSQIRSAKVQNKGLADLKNIVKRLEKEMAMLSVKPSKKKNKNKQLPEQSKSQEHSSVGL